MKDRTTSEAADGPSPAGAGPDGAEQPRLRRRHRRWVYLAVFLVLGSWFAHFAHSRITRQPSPRPKYWKARIAQLDPPGDGALSITEAKYILLAKPSMPSVGSHGRRVETTILRGIWKYYRPDVIAGSEYFSSEEFVGTRAALREALQVGWATPIKSYPAEEDVLKSKHSQWADALVAHSRWSREQAGGMTTPVEDWLLALQLGRQLRRPQLSGHLLRASWIERDVAREMMRTAKEPHGVLDARALAEDIETILGPVLKPSGLLEGQRLFMHMLLESIYVRGDGNWIVVSKVLSTFPDPWWRGALSAPMAWNLTSPLFHDLPTAQRRLDEYFDALDGLTDLAACARMETEDKQHWSRLRPSALDGLQEYATRRYVGGLIDNAVGTYYEARCSLEAAVTMIALHEYHREHGHYPQNLDGLVPQYLPRLPIDYVDRRILRYRTEGDAYLLYSIGSDGTDNGGKEIPSYTGSWLNYPDDGWWVTHADVVFSRAKRAKYYP